ncbi:NAD(P)H-binding protein, partial [Streptomyces sp. NPDC005373]
MIVVTGATGNVGRPLTQALAEAGEQVTAVSRHAAAVPDGVRHVSADLAEPAGLTLALDGAKALFLLLSGDLHAPEARPTDIIDLAAASGVRRVVLLSSQGVATRPLGPSRIAMRAVEDALRESGLDWAVLRPGGFASNAFAWGESVRTQGTVAAPFGDVGVPIVDPGDIAEVAAACLLDDRHAGGVFELTGPEVITPRQQAEAIAVALGSPVRFHELTREEAKAAMTRFVPPELAD